MWVSGSGIRGGWILKPNQAGEYTWHGIMGGAMDNICNDIGVDKEGNVYVSGNFTPDHDLDPFSNTLTVSDTTFSAFPIKIGTC